MITLKDKIRDYLINKPKCLHDFAYCETCVNSLSNFIEKIIEQTEIDKMNNCKK